MADIVLVLDESGSMDVQRDKIISGVNELLQSQRNKAREAAVTNPAAMDTQLHIYRFSDKVKEPLTGNIGSFPPLTREQYKPDGMTALFDAIGTVVRNLEDRQDAGRRVVLVIATDGDDNSSKEHKREAIKAKLTALRERQPVGWKVMYLSENVEKQGDAIGIRGCHNKSAKAGQMHTAFTNARCQSALAAACYGPQETYEEEMGANFFD